MNIGFLQFEPIFLDVEENVNKIFSFIRNSSNIDFLVLPELANSGYTFQNKGELEKVAEEIPKGYFTEKMCEIAKEKNLHIVAGICEKHGEKFFNSAILVGPEGYIDTYRKLHLFDREKMFFEPGNTPLQVYDIGKAKIGIIICFDWIYPETIRVLALKGADIIAHSANLVLPYSQTAMLARSIENRIFTITANRIGTEKNGEVEFYFTGQSQITSPKMDVLFRASKDKEELFMTTVDIELAKTKWLNEYNNLFDDRRPEFYRSLTNS